MYKLEKNLLHVQKRIQAAAHRSSRSDEDITLLAVSKRHSADNIRDAYQCGQRDFGENYLQEARDKQQKLRDCEIIWHFIGPIQSNKTRTIAENFDWVHSVGRLKIAQRLSEQRPKSLAPLKICIQINIDNEDSKSGVTPQDAYELAAEIQLLPNLKLCGLMTIPAARESIEQQGHAFAQLAQLSQTLKSQLELTEFDTLSMGMSGDLDAAIAEGATIVRIGTAIFGQRS
ncbi:MAG: pyridoxal phosphate enzyme (YggS family) [Flavobacteriales bacterium]|jgi:pyridoxal phosphate enzyme (YggS family)